MTRKLIATTNCNIDRLGAEQPTTAKPNANIKPTKKQIAYSARAEASFKAIEEAANEPIATKTRAPRKAKVQVIEVVEAARLYFQLAGLAGNAKGDKATELAGYRKAVYGWYVAEYSKAPYLGKSHAA